MKHDPKNRWIIQDQVDQEQQQPPDEKANFLGEAVKELGDLNQPPKKDEEEEEEEEEESEEEKKKKEEESKKNESLFKRNKPKEEVKKEESKKPDKNESMEILRAQRDEIKSKYETLNAEVSKLGDGVSLEVISPLVDYVKEALGDKLISQETISEIVNQIKTKDQELEKISKEANETKGKLREINIEFDEDFLNQYLKPAQQTEEALFLEYAQIGADGKPLAQEALKKVGQAFFGTKEKPIDISKLSGHEVKAIMTQYAKDYKQETGEDLPAVSVTNVMGSIRTFVGSMEKLRAARSDWENTKKSSQTAAQAEAQKQKELADRKSKDTRKSMFQKAFDSLDESKYEGILSSEEIGNLFTEEYKYSESIFSEKPPTWDEMALRSFKARSHNNLLEKYRELEEYTKELEKKVGGEIKGGGGGKGNVKTGEKVDFLGPAASIIKGG